MIEKSIQRYSEATSQYPFFVFLGDEGYKKTYDNLPLLGFEELALSRFCLEGDRLPDFDAFLGQMSTSIRLGKKLFATGLGEYLALKGGTETNRVLAMLKDFNIGTNKVVLLLRGIGFHATELTKDPRFDDRRCFIDQDLWSDLSFYFFKTNISVKGTSSFQGLLRQMEIGKTGIIRVRTSLDFSSATLPIKTFSSSYEIAISQVKNLRVEEDCGSADQWDVLVNELHDYNGSIESLFAAHGFNSFNAEIQKGLLGTDYRNWLFFLYLKSHIDTIKNKYLRFVIERTRKLEDFRFNLLNCILDIRHDDKEFSFLYQERKTLVEKIPETVVNAYVENTRIKLQDQIHYLTDNTSVEKRELISFVSEYGISPKIKDVFPSLQAYLEHYVITTPPLAEFLTKYFADYKRQKLSNKIDEDFLTMVTQLATKRKYNQLPTRESIVEKLDSPEAYLFWVDALGVEFLSLIDCLAKELNLSLRVNIARAQLPTLTTTNSTFYENWESAKMHDYRLDETKHKDSGGYNFTKNQLPIHIVSEIEVIENVLERTAELLLKGEYKKVIITSDHGASRLAVLHKQEEKYETVTGGQNSGRCCEAFPECDLPCATEENGYLVLADYGRFKGSRAANVEVHGGASLEEVIVPIIELCKQDRKSEIRIIEKEIRVDYRNGAEFQFFIKPEGRNVLVVFQEKCYSAEPLGPNVFKIKIPELRRAGEYTVDFFVDETKVGNLTFNARGRSGNVNNDFEDLF